MWWWLAGAGVAALVGYELHLAFRGVPTWILIVAMQPISILFGLWLSRSRLSVTADAAPNPTPASDDRTAPSPVEPARGGGELHVSGRAHLPREVIARTVSVPPSARRAAMGRQLDPAAFVHQRPWIAPLALIVLDDPDDPTPYWLVSTRHPDLLLDAIGAPRTSVSDAAATESGAGTGENGVSTSETGAGGGTDNEAAPDDE